MASKDDDYRFLPIADAKFAINQRVNLMGVIVETGIPKRSKGTDCFCSLKIVDESCHTPGISVTMFAANMEKLPRVESDGDIILLSRVVMKTHGAEVNVLFDKRFSSFALFEGRHSTNFVPYQVSPNFRQRDHDKKLIVDLRKWSSDCQLDGGEFLMLREIKVGQLNMLCKVLHICEVSRNKWMIFLWDGTDTPPVNIQTRLEDEMDSPLPLRLEPFPLPRDVLVTFPAVGTVLRVIVDQENEKFGLHLLETNRWVKFVNLTCDVHSGLWCGQLMPFTKLRYLPKDDALVTQFERLYGDRLSSELGRIPFSSFPWCSRVTETDYDVKPFATLMEILTYPEVTAKFKCVVRIVAAFPWKAEDFRSPLGTYRIRLTLEDPTARIHAFVYAEDGEKLFGGYPCLEVLTRKRNRLLGIAESGGVCSEIKDADRNPPWVQCCIKSYYLDKSDIWGSRNYRIFATEVVE